ncbi:hypothetical protein [Blastococcus brunescens]|uniref:Glycosyltransferase RgtA/B/C/D-like domain-containing protein n=1 Tax=Blastococcus brunescens TaxID=1564165 RepID=A0ABZ1B0R1_9ACTN|nr:hypothetical protein [Blastococcus sp. BMG 8361]WRL62914.1 hypothetical protein U6N30_24075 [Blastococcus sp. BMG 8361]
MAVVPAPVSSDAVDMKEAGPPDRARRSGRLRHPAVLGLVTALAASAASIALKLAVPTSLNLSGYDGLLFARNATYLADGHWQGPYSLVTIAKGMGYPGFMAAAHTVGIPLAAAEQLAYLVAIAVLCGVVLAVTGRYAVATVCFVFLALDPVNVGSASADVLRDNLYASQSLFFVSAAALTVLAVVRRARMVWVILAAVLCGAAGGFGWITREEGPALLPPVLVLVALAWLCARTREPDRPAGWGPRLRRVVRPATALGVAVVAFAVPVLGVAAVNGHQYGAQLTNELGRAPSCGRTRTGPAWTSNRSCRGCRSTPSSAVWSTR